MQHQYIATNYKERIEMFAYRYLYIKYSVDLLIQHATLINYDSQLPLCFQSDEITHTILRQQA